MAAPAFRESGKPLPAKFVTKSGGGEVLAAPGEHKAYVIYDIMWDGSVGEPGNLRAAASPSPTLIFLADGHSNYTSPIQWPTNSAIVSDLGYLTITYDIIDV